MRVQADERTGDAVSSDAPAGGVDIARRRVGVRGVVLDTVEFEVERELQPEHPWRDVYVNLARWRVLQVQAGQFKLPFGLDENASSTNLNFIYRSLASNHLAPGRDQGVMLHGRLRGRYLRYEAAVFDHDGRNARTDNPERVFGGRTSVGRTRASPFAGARDGPWSVLRDLQVGLAWTRSTVPEGIPAIRGRMVLDAAFLPARYYVDGTRQRVGVEFRWRPGPVSVESEYIRMTTERRGEGVDDTNLAPLLETAWYVAGTLAVTGERKSRGLDTPRRPFLQGGIGALEIAARLESMAFGSLGQGELPSASPRAEVIRGNRDLATTLGLNWYLNRWIKVQANLIRERLDDPALGPIPGQRLYWSRAVRLQCTL
ncbi:MAG: OprO/OprP family phosphate-selective porin [Vicinamibacterales bacterium]